jgi:hypothetical protein
MKPRNWLIGVSHIGMVLVLELWFSARSSSQGSSHSVNGLPLAAALLTVAAGYRVSGFVHDPFQSFSASAMLSGN